MVFKNTTKILIELISVALPLVLSRYVNDFLTFSGKVNFFEVASVIGVDC